MKISFTGTHGTGKSTAVFDLAKQMKIENPNKTVGVFMENAKHSPLGFNKNRPKETQLWIFCNQLQSEITLSTKYDIVITDRTVFDSIAYAYYFGFKDLADVLFQTGYHFIHTYDKIIFKTIKNNNYLYSDGVRIVDDDEYRQGIENELIIIYNKLKDLGAKFEFVIF
jgi:thymidylate kinase